jgi:hypothetical protein
LIHRSPQIVAFAVNRQKYFIQVPLVPRARPAPPQPIGIILAFSTGQILTHFKMDICERLSHRMHHSTAMTT